MLAVARAYHFLIPKSFRDCLEYILVATEVYTMCMHFLEGKKKDLQKLAWKYLIADKIEFNMKAVYERNAVFKQ